MKKENNMEDIIKVLKKHKIVNKKQNSDKIIEKRIIEDLKNLNFNLFNFPITNKIEETLLELFNKLITTNHYENNNRQLFIDFCNQLNFSNEFLMKLKSKDLLQLSQYPLSKKIELVLNNTGLIEYICETNKDNDIIIKTILIQMNI